LSAQRSKISLVPNLLNYLSNICSNTFVGAIADVTFPSDPLLVMVADKQVTVIIHIFTFTLLHSVYGTLLIKKIKAATAKKVEEEMNTNSEHNKDEMLPKEQLLYEIKFIQED
jgi:hypothetical protein